VNQVPRTIKVNGGSLLGAWGLTLKIRVNARWGWTKKVPSKGDFLVVVVSRSLRGATLRKSRESFVLIVVLGMRNRRTLIIRIRIPNIPIRKNPSLSRTTFAETPSESPIGFGFSSGTCEIIVESFVVSLLGIKIQSVRITHLLRSCLRCLPPDISTTVTWCNTFFRPSGVNLNC
jgi:hypothetical protein